jgi:hypothetical protein
MQAAAPPLPAASSLASILLPAVPLVLSLLMPLAAPLLLKNLVLSLRVPPLLLLVTMLLVKFPLLLFLSIVSQLVRLPDFCAVAPLLCLCCHLTYHLGGSVRKLYLYRADSLLYHVRRVYSLLKKWSLRILLRRKLICALVLSDLAVVADRV